ncbi:MAG: sulfotransferase family protein [Burkholderiales bacterium]
MALEIIGAGFGRTGTMSLYTALNQLGFPCYHMAEVLENKNNTTHLDFWLRVARTPPGTQHDWEQVFSNYTAAVDNPACCVWRELLATYPRAKVILTTHVRGPEAWYESTIDTIYFTENRWQFKVLEIFTPFGRKFGEMSRRLIWQRSHRGTMNDKAAAIADYKRHVDEVKAGVPAAQLLVFSADQGWQPLCDFLGVPVPATPFPNVNDRAQIQQVLRTITRGAYVIIGALAATVAALVWGVFRLLA